MNRVNRVLMGTVGAALAIAANAAAAQTSVTFGRITAVAPVTEANRNAQVGGAIIGGTIGAVAGSGRSGSNRALGGLGGAFAGQQIGRLTTQRQAFEYTILVDRARTIRVISDQSGKRVGDCVSVEQGSFNNLRLVADAKCAQPSRPPAAAAPAAAPAPKPTQTDIRQADACIQAKEQLLAAETDETFDRAERRVRLLCGE